MVGLDTLSLVHIVLYLKLKLINLSWELQFCFYFQTKKKGLINKLLRHEFDLLSFQIQWNTQNLTPLQKTLCVPTLPSQRYLQAVLICQLEIQ